MNEKREKKKIDFSSPAAKFKFACFFFVTFAPKFEQCCQMNGETGIRI